MPATNQALRALLVNSWLPTRPMYDMEGQKDKFRVYMISPDNAATAKSREDNKDARDLEELCGERGDNLSKVNTDITFNQSILAPETFLSLVANRCTIYEATLVVDSANWDAVSNPLAYRFYRQLGLVITDTGFRRFCKASPRTIVQRLFGWILQMSDAFECHVNSVPCNTMNALYVLSGETHHIGTSSLKLARELQDDVLTKMVRIISNTDSVPHCSLNTSLDNKAAAKRLAETKSAPSRGARPEKAQRTSTSHTAGSATPSEPANTYGCLVFRKREPMPTVTETDPRKRVCAPFVRDGATCRKHGRCLSLHNNKPETWPIAILRAWAELVEKTPELNWNSDIDEDAIATAISNTPDEPTTA